METRHVLTFLVRLQAQGTTHHPQRYTGMWDVFTKTLQQEGPKGLYRGLTPNLLKVIPAVSIVSATKLRKDLYTIANHPSLF